MTPKLVSATDVIAALDRFDAIIDVRSPSEFADDHLPGAVNWPVLNDDERARVGTLYVQTSPMAARQIGAALVARNIAAAIERHVQGLPREWQPLVYCWRGGQRSGAMAWFLGQIGFRTAQLQGGYKAYRAQVRADLAELPLKFSYRVLAGRTGSGKTRLLQALSAAGAQVLDLEAIACHRGSVLGGLPGTPQPSQKAFDTALWCALRALDPARPVFVESESKKVGSLQLPDALVLRMREHGQCLRVQMSDEARTQLLLEEYGFFARDVEGFCKLLDALVDLRGRERVQHWQAMARAGQWAELFALLMQDHYDPLYERSMKRHFAGLATAPVVDLADGGPAALQRAAHALVA
jgi:tRNA 2-selenouridine synthase